MQLKTIFFCFTFLLGQTFLIAQTQSYRFSAAELNKGISGPGLQPNMDEVPWSIDASLANLVDEESYIKVVQLYGNTYALKAQNIKGEATFTSQWFVRECMDLYRFDIVVNTSAGLDRPSDNAKLYYQTRPDGNLILFEENGHISGNGEPVHTDSPGYVITKTNNINADSARVIIKMRNNDAGEFYNFTDIYVVPRGNTFYYFTEPEVDINEPEVGRVTHRFDVVKNQSSFAAVVTVNDITPTGEGFATADEDYEFMPQIFQYNFEFGPIAGAQEGHIDILGDAEDNEPDEIIILEMTAVEEGGIEYCNRQHTITIKGNSALPVHLTTFEALPERHRGIRLNWEMVNSDNILQFQVEHSIDGINFKNCGWVEVVNGQKKYTFFHDKAQHGKNYYRLAQKSIDGKIEYSSIINAGLQLNSLEISPVPAEDYLNLNLPSSMKEDAKILIYNALGQMQAEWKIAKGSEQKTLLLPDNINNGVYYLYLEGYGMKRFVVN